ncbi:hypothetical protein [Bradyrhizobium sp. STM 3562]|uniref:hypothetical protein n=1 Tax=Bradyrhizobium sp. STM 3562 TaxID=578924 RepID=UPI00388E7FAC
MGIEPPEVPPPTPGHPTVPPPENPPGNPNPERPPPLREPGEPPRPDELPPGRPDEVPVRGPNGPRTPNPATDVQIDRPAVPGPDLDHGASDIPRGKI